MGFKQRTLDNPFVYQGYESPAYFCDREEETHQLKSHLQNGRNVTLISLRRIGKTGLIKNTYYHIQQERPDAVCLYVDIYATKSLRDFVQLLGSTVLQGLVKKDSSFLEKAAAFVSTLRPVISLDPLTGTPSVSVSVEPSQEEFTIRSIFKYLNESRREIYLAIDEFQQITEYPETGTEALLRSFIQFTQHVHFIFSGSKFHLMSEMFGSPKRPFYQSTEIMSLQPLPPAVYASFCQRFFRAKGGDLRAEIFQEIYDLFDGHTWYVQCVMNRLYEANTVVDSGQQVNEALLAILRGRVAQYEELSRFFTANQFNLLKAIAREGTVAQPTSARFLKTYNLSGASSIKVALNVLLDKELVYRKPEGYIIYDRLMALWLKRQ